MERHGTLGLFDIARRVFAGETTHTPNAIEAAYTEQGMGSDTYLGPGRPLTPARGYSGTPRAMDYPTAVNIGYKNRQQWGRTSYEVLRELLRSYDIATICKNHKIDELRSMEPLFNAKEGFTGDADGAIDAAKRALEFPDRENPWDQWLAMWMENILTFDAGPLYRRRNYDGDVIGLEVLDGCTIYPLIDEHGRRPKPPAEAYQQIIKGEVSQLFTADDLVYTRFRSQTDSPYGMAPLESIVVNMSTDLKAQWHFLQLFTEGSIPGGFGEAPPDVSSPDQVAEWQDYWDSMFMGDQSILHKLIIVPNGMKVTETAPKTFDRAFPEWLAMKTAMAFGVVPQDLGFTQDVNRANGETQTDIQFRVNTLPWVRFVERWMTRYLQHDLGLPVEFRLNTGRDKEDRLAEAQAWKIYTESGFASVDEAREELLGLPVDNERPIPRGLVLPRQGFVPLDSILAISGKTDPETKAPTADAELPYPFDGTPGLMPDKLPGSPAFHRAEQNPDDPEHPETQKPTPGSGVVQDPNTAQPTEKDATTGMTAATGDAGIDLKRKDELAKFAAFVKARKRNGKWRDFEFVHHTPAEAAQLNKAARDGDADPKGSWRDNPPNPTPFHTVDLALTDHWAPLVAAALAGGVDTDALAEDALEAAWTAAEATDAAAEVYATGRLEAVLSGAHRAGFIAGALSAGEQTGTPGLLTGFTTATVEFRTPEDAPLPVLDALTGTAWQQALAEAGVTVKGITDTTMQRMGVLIEQAVELGHTVDRLAADLDAYLSDPARAETIAHTETARMATTASLAVYRAYGLQQWDLVTSAGACASICLPFEAANPHSVSESGPPLHPRCRCAASPHIEGI